MKTLNWAILGTGTIANEMAASMQKHGRPAYAVGNRTYEKAKAFGQKYGIQKVYADFQEMFIDPEVDIIYIATPHNKHFEFMKQALENGKHILVEKSITLNSAELDETMALSSDEAVATVGADGTVTALKEGTAVITAKCGEKSAECTVTVKAEAVMPTSITMEPTTLSLTVGQKYTLIATILPENATNKSVTWSSNAPDIVEVTAGGAVTAKAAGTATVTASAANGLAVTCIVTVTVTVAGE